MAHRPMIDNSVNAVRSKQNLSCNWTGSADFGRLVPIHWEELLQGDHIIRFHPKVEMQMLSFASPTFGKIDLYLHSFVVPIRQIHSHFYDIWSRAGVYKNEPLLHLTPKDFFDNYRASLQTDAVKRAAFKHWTSLGLNPFFALDSGVTDNVTPISLYPFLAYNKIWWDFYRDPEVLRDESKSQYIFDGSISDFRNDQDSWNKFMLPHVRTIKNNWISDLFSSSGETPMENDLVFANSDLPWINAAGSPSNTDLGPDVLPYEMSSGEVIPTDTTAKMNRLIESLTRLSERLSLSGKRQIEALFARYGVKPNWSKMNLAQYCGGAKSSVLISDIVSNSDTVSGENGSPLGAKGGAGYAGLDDMNIEVSVDEPCIFMCLASVMPHIHFVQGLSKKWQRRDLVDMFQNSLQYVGQVAVSKREVAMKYRDNQNYNPSHDGDTFAFCDPYYEYKMGLDILAGDFMTYHNVQLPTHERQAKDILYMQSMEQYIDYPFNRNFNLENLKVDGDQFNKIFSYLGGSVWEDVDDHFHLCIDKEFIIDRPMDGFAIPTVETTAAPHKKDVVLSSDKML